MATSPTAISLPKTALTPNRLAIESQVELAKIIERGEPVYPPLARQTRVQGTVRLHAIIAIDGSVEELEVISGHPLLIQLAFDAVRRWRYAPTVLNGQPVEVDTTIDVIFSVEENRSPSVSSSATALVFADFPASAENRRQVPQ